VWDGHFTAAYFDHQGLYSFGRQPEAIHWDAVQLARALRVVAEAEPLTAALEQFPALFQRALRDALFRRLGVIARDLAADMELVVAIEETLAETRIGIDRFFFEWRGGSLRAPAPAYDGGEFAALRALLARQRPAPGALDHEYWSDPEPCAMLIDEVEAIWARIDSDDDWAPLEAKVAAVRRMGAAMRSGANA